MGGWFGCAPALLESAGTKPAVFEEITSMTVSIVDPEEAAPIGKVEHIKRTTIYDGQSQSAMNLRNLGHQEVGR